MVSDAAGVTQLAGALRKADTIGVDTEFFRERTFFPIVGLVQLNADGELFLVDPLAVPLQDALADTLADQSKSKIFHSASEDLQLFEHCCGVLPKPLIDTQIAASFAGIGPSVAYQRLVHHVTGQELPKDQTRSNWLERPLTEKQLRYAVQDVEFLLQIWDTLSAEIEARGSLSWCLEEMRRVGEPESAFPTPEACFARIKGAARLQPTAQARLRHLAAWRERTARAADVPRSFIIRDGALVDIAKRPPQNRNVLGSSDLMHPSAVRKYGKGLIEALQVDNGDGPKVALLPRAELNSSDTAVLAELQTLVRAQAEHLDLPPELLARKRDLVELFQRDELEHAPLVLTGWRLQVIGETLLEAMDG